MKCVQALSIGGNLTWYFINRFVSATTKILLYGITQEQNYGSFSLYSGYVREATKYLYNGSSIKALPPPLPSSLMAVGTLAVKKKVQTKFFSLMARPWPSPLMALPLKKILLAFIREYKCTVIDLCLLLYQWAKYGKINSNFLQDITLFKNNLSWWQAKLISTRSLNTVISWVFTAVRFIPVYR